MVKMLTSALSPNDLLQPGWLQTTGLAAFEVGRFTMPGDLADKAED